MAERQRVKTILDGGQPDRVPWFGDLNQVPPNGLESRVRRVRELVDECGVY